MEKVAYHADSGHSTPEQKPIQQSTHDTTTVAAATAAPPAPPDGGSINADCPIANRRWQHKTTYAALIAVAIYTSPKKRLRMEQIYSFIEAHSAMIPAVSHPSWKNSCRHNLSLRQCFKKVPQLSSDGKRLRSYWKLDTSCLPAAAEEMIHAVTKMQRTSGNDARGAQRFQKHCGWDVTEDDDAEEIGHTEEIGHMLHSGHQGGGIAPVAQPVMGYPVSHHNPGAASAMHPMLQGGLPRYHGMPQMMYPGMPLSPGMPPEMMPHIMHPMTMMTGHVGPRGMPLGMPPGMPGFYVQRPAGGYRMVPMQGPRGVQMVPMPGGGYRRQIPVPVDPAAVHRHHWHFQQQQMAAMYARVPAAQPMMGQAAPVPPPDDAAVAYAAAAAKRAAQPPVVRTKVEEIYSDDDDNDTATTAATRLPRRA